MKYKILASWVNKHPPKHAGRRHAHLNSMFTGVLYIDIPDDHDSLPTDLNKIVFELTKNHLEGV